MTEMHVNILRDVAKNPNIIQILKDGRTLTVTYDGDNMRFIGDRSLIPSVPEALQMAFPYELESQSRPAWYDRNPKTVSEGYKGTLTPHGVTKRLTYTCPTDRKAMVEVLQCQTTRVTAAAPAGLSDSIWWIVPAGGSGDWILRSQIYTNNVGDNSDQAVGASLMLQKDDTIYGESSDVSTGGSCVHCFSYKITEFDA